MQRSYALTTLYSPELLVVFWRVNVDRTSRKWHTKDLVMMSDHDLLCFFSGSQCCQFREKGTTK